MIDGKGISEFNRNQHQDIIGCRVWFLKVVS
jgi:hypothetical protein